MPMKSSTLRSWWRVPVSPLLCFGLAWFAAHTEVVQRFEWRSLDWRTGYRVRFQPPPDPRIVVVLFEDATEMNFVNWPPDRAVHAELIKLLTLAKPAVVTWDVILDASREGEGDAEMGEAAAIAARAGVTVITGGVTSPEPVEEEPTPPGPTRALTQVEGDVSAVLGDEHALKPFPALRASSVYGFVDTPPGMGGVRREIPLVVRVGETLYPSLALQTVMAYYDVAPEDVRVRLGDAVYLETGDGVRRLPVSEAGRFLLNYRYDLDEHGSDFVLMTYFEAMVKLHERFLEEKADVALPPLEGGIVFIGQTVTGKADVGPTPRSAISPLVLIHANLVHNVLTDDLAQRAPEWAVWLGAVLLGYVGVAIGLKRSVWALAAFGLVSAAVYLIAAYAVWIEFSVWLPMMAPLLGFAALHFLIIGRRVREEQKGREQVKQMFGTYLSPELLKRMMRDGRNIAAVSSERRPVTILFCDLRDFTSMAEQLKDDALIAQLNEYLAAMVECIHAEGGTLHKFIGDAVMAVWGDLASEGIERDARRAARAALAMQEVLGRLNEAWVRDGKPAFRMGVGLNHGVVLIGNVGSPRRMEFTAIGDAVNLASRLESLNKELKTEILVGESLRDLLKDDFRLRARGEVAVKGKAGAVAVYELQGAA
jgi:adenylate cyclase